MRATNMAVATGFGFEWSLIKVLGRVRVPPWGHSPSVGPRARVPSSILWVRVWGLGFEPRVRVWGPIPGSGPK
uniref:Uncharacterized protein n=1 Tax=Cannabis sativa TaxID=3483 RepID=A0A803Q7I9_CANSA